MAAYLDDVIVFDSDPMAHVLTMRALVERLRKHNLKLCPSKARLGATGADVMGHSISPAGACPNAEKIRFDQNDHAAGSKAGPRLAGRCGVLQQIPA